MLQGKVVAKTQWDGSPAVGDDEETEVRHPALQQQIGKSIISLKLT